MRKDTHILEDSGLPHVQEAALFTLRLEPTGSHYTKQRNQQIQHSFFWGGVEA
ncbi:hypothetical protein JOB18_040124 [Solea senegalensis]|uniref:Uncharacterized protein n=1 Tax=Solea senegalensis TaxID=28829 RepID=A0AAV6TB74_SOLSE|nr:hypothetical protein JOB18_040124 [Solea senegalensis]